MQRLSTGLRINSAKDDAAGLAVSNALSSRIQGLNQAGRNASDAVSMLQTAEGGLQAVTESLQRMRELAVQAASDSIGDTERDYLDVEFQQLITEIDRIVNSSSYNSVQLLDGTNGAMTFQVGANNDATNDRISVSIADSNTAALGATATTATLTGTALGGAISDGDFTIKVGTGSALDIGAVSVTGTTNFAANVKAAVEAANSDVTATVGGASISMGDFTTVTGSTDAADVVSFSVTNGATQVDIMSSVDSSSDITAAIVDAAIDDASTSLTTAGITVTGSAANGDLKFSNTTGANLVVSMTITDNVGTADTITGGFEQLGTPGENAAAQTETAYGSLTLTASGAITVAGSDTVNAGFIADNLTAALAGTAVSELDVQDTTNSQTAIASIDSALSTVNSTRASIGSYQSAFETMIANLSVESENASAARSRILDADFAQESAALAKTQVLQQAGISVLAQANAMPQQVLALLQ
jgi:flagellin